ncbi:MAG: helix-turn-helix domain-containing protein [Pseudomonadota bacterium]
MPDAFVATNADLRVITANRAFYDLMALSNASEVDGVLFDRFFERPSVDCKVLIANVTEHGIVRRFASSMATKFGQSVNVEIAACQLEMSGESILGFWIRPTNSLITGTETKKDNLARSNEQIANLVGHMPLKDIVRDTTAMIETLCIETALELTKNNRASAAQMLGVSRQSLYTKLGNDKGKKE